MGQTRWRANVALWGATALCVFLAVGFAYAVPGIKHFDINEQQRSGRGEPGAPGHDGVVALANRGGVICTGTLLRPDVVLTAAHCRTATGVFSGASPNARLGRARVARFVAHSSRGVDLGLAFLKTPLPGPRYALAIDDVLEGRARFVGYGCEDDRGCRELGKRKYFDFPMRDSEARCSWARSSELGCSPTTEMVLPRGVGADTCRGDSGGPLLRPNPLHDANDPESTPWFVVAVTSRGLAHAERLCGEGGIYVRIATQKAWIEKTLKRFDEANNPPN